MIDIEREKLPKEYERVVLEEYYNLFRDMYGASNPILRGRKTFSTDRSKLTEKDLADPILTSSIGTLESVARNDNIEFVLYKEDDGRISAIARIRVNEGKEIHIAEVLFLEYQDDEEKRKIINSLVATISEYALNLDCPELYYEIPKNDSLSISTVIEDGFGRIIESEKITSVYRTFVFYKTLMPKRRKSNEWTRSRQQRSGQN